MATENPQDGRQCPNCGVDGYVHPDVPERELIENPDQALIHRCGNTGCAVDQYFAVRGEGAIK